MLLLIYHNYLSWRRLSSLYMSQQIGPFLARRFREICKESNKSKRLAEYNKISDEEITAIEQLLKKVDKRDFDLESALNKFLRAED